MRTRQIKPLSRFTGWFFRLPNILYRIGLGWMLGGRFLQVTHTGRKSGLLRHTVIEVVSHDKASGTYYVVAAWGEKADWLLNLEKTPDCRVQVGRHRFEARARRLSNQEAETVILDYAHRHPATMRGLASFMGFQVDGSDADYRKMIRQLPVIAFVPR